MKVECMLYAGNHRDKARVRSPTRLSIRRDTTDDPPRTRILRQSAIVLIGSLRRRCRFSTETAGQRRGDWASGAGV